jgi:NADH-quinone oxidoreductase subunit N
VNYSALLAGLPAIGPEILLLVLAFVIMAFDLFLAPSNKPLVARLTVGGLLIILAISFAASPSGEPVLGGMVCVDLWTQLFRALFLVAGVLVALVSLGDKSVRQGGEYYSLLVLSIAGMSLMAAAYNLLMVYLALETTGITLYLLTAYLRDSRSAEAGLKYFLFGAFTSTIMLYGLSLLYGFTRATGYTEVAAGLSGLPDKLPVILGMMLVAAGLGFKISMVPFHFWAPDVYEGAPTPITAFISVASKAAGFAVLLRFLMVVFPSVQVQWIYMLTALSAVTMSVGNVVALLQKNIKRMLAYSSIAQAGYMLIGVVAVSQGSVKPYGPAAVLFYLGVYVLTNVAAFGVISAVTNALGSEQLSAFAGLSRRSLGLSLAMLAAMLSLGGVPPLAGFFAKFFVFSAAMGQGLVWLVVLGVLNSLLALYYYLMVLKYVFVDRSEGDEQPLEVPFALNTGLWVSVAGILILGVFATPWYDLVARAVNGAF